MNTKRIAGLLTGAVMLVQPAAANFPVFAAEKPENAVSLSEFAQRVQGLTASDSGKEFYDSLEFDTETGVLTADGELTDGTVGDLSVQDGELMLQTGTLPKRSGSGESDALYTPFYEAAEAYGFTYSQTGNTVTLTNEFQTARLIVKAAGSIETYGAESAAEGYNHLHILQYGTAAEAYTAYQKFLEDTNVIYVQPSHRVQIETAAETAFLTGAEINDTQTHTYNTWGADVIGIEDFISTYLNAELLPEVIVSVVDTGINMVPTLFDGRVLDGGVNYSDSGDDSADDDYGHGTHCSGTICELTPENVKILPVKVFDLNGSAADEQIYLGIVYSIEQGADVINMSFGGLGVSPLEIEAISIAEENNVICCAAAGNNADDAAYYYPGGIAESITVGAVDADMELALFSNYGRMLDVVAPGVGIVSYVTGDTETLESWNGTSMATPHVAACCALLRTYDKDLTPRRAEALLQSNAADLGDEGFDETFGWGLVSMRDFQWNDGICMAPVYSVDAGNYGVQVEVELSCETEDVQIYYTTDGTEPSPENGILYCEPICLTETTVLLAVAARTGYVTSRVSEAVYMIGGKDIADAFAVEDHTLLQYRGVAQQLTVPDSVNGEKITAIAADAFAGNHYTKQIILSENVETVGDGAFSECSVLQTVYAPGARKIGEKAFAGCPQLTSVTMADRLDEIGESAFAACASLVSVHLDGIAKLPASVCKSCGSLQTVTAPDAVRISDEAFLNCSAMTLLECDFTKVTAIGNSAFAGCTEWQGRLCLDTLETLGEGAFSGDRSLLRVSLPERITVLPSTVFSGCSGLKLLQLPGVSEISANALAIGNMASDIAVELDYTKITKVSTNAFFGFPIGNGRDAVSFDSLRELSYRSFAGVYAGGLQFPLVTDVPQNAFSESQIGFVGLESAQSLAKGSLSGCIAAVLSEAAVSIDPDACPEGTWICTLDEIPALENLSQPISLCDEPLIFRWTNPEVTAEQHAQTVLYVLGCGVGLTAQWYLTDGETQTAIDGATDTVYIPDTSAVGIQSYLCVLTDAGGKTEQITVTLTVTEETADAAQMEPDTNIYLTGADAVQYTIVPAASGDYTLTAETGAPLAGMLTDAAGRTVGDFSHAGFTDSMTVSLLEGARYTLQAKPMWSSAYALLLTDSSEERTPLSACTVTITGGGSREYEAAFAPAVTVTAPDGTLLTADEDYTVQVVQHNQSCTVSVFGIGAYCGYAERQLTVYPRISADTAVPVSIRSSGDTSVYAFVPLASGTYYFYASYGEGYADEMNAYYRNGSYSAGSLYANLRTSCVVSDRPDGLGTTLAVSSYNAYTGYYFYNSVELNAGQTYYFLCGGGSAAEYSLVVTQTPREIRRASVTGDLYGFYQSGKFVYPAITVSWNGTELTEGKDYQLIYINNDAPGQATLMIAGKGLYCGTLSKQFLIDYQPSKLSGQEIAVGETASVSCSTKRAEVLYFTVDTGDAETARYRVINERTSGGPMKYVLYAYSAQGKFFSQMTAISGQTDDYALKSGTYCIVVYRQYANVVSGANFTVVMPYELDQAELTIGDMPYTGTEVYPPITVTAADGTLLTEGRDYIVSYPERHTLFGETRVVLRATNRSYGTCTGYFEIYVDLPEDAPEITVGSHTAVLTLDDRLAFYKLTAETETTYTLASSDVMNIVLRVFSPEAELLAQDYGNQTKSVSFTVPAGETRYLMLKFNSNDRSGTMHFQLETALRLLTDCEVVSEHVYYTGERVLPQVTFTDGDYTLQEGVDYTLRYTDNDERIGTATANYIGMGDYFGTCDVTYYIVAESLPELESESFAPYPIVLDTVYMPSADLEHDYVVARYTAGLDDSMKLSVYNAACSLSVQRYDSSGAFAESVFIELNAMQASGEMTFDLAAGETCYLLFSAQNISNYNQSFRFMLTDPGCPDFKTVNDTEHGVTYRVFSAMNYAEVYKLNTSLSEITLLPEISGVPVSFVPEGLFTRIPDTSVVYGYAGCAAAEYADTYLFAYEEVSAETETAGDLNGDGACTMADAVLLSHILSEHAAVSVQPWQLVRADWNSDQMLDARDLSSMLRYLAGETA